MQATLHTQTLSPLMNRCNHAQKPPAEDISTPINRRRQRPQVRPPRLKRFLLRSKGLRWVDGGCSSGWDKPCCGCCAHEGERGDHQDGGFHAFGVVELR